MPEPFDFMHQIGACLLNHAEGHCVSGHGLFIAAKPDPTLSGYAFTFYIVETGNFGVDSTLGVFRNIE